MATVDPYTANKFAAEAGARAQRYPNPFFDLANNYIPGNIKTLFKYCHAFFHSDPFLSNVVRKLTEYPITELLYSAETTEEQREKYDRILIDKLKIRTVLIEVGLDYYTYGNCFVSSIMLFKRYLKDPNTGTMYQIEDKNIKWTFKKFDFYATLPGATSETLMEVVDEPINSIESFRLVRWDPNNITIKYNPINGRSRYFYEIPSSIKKEIMTGDRTALMDTPLVFIQALKGGKVVELDEKNLYHFKRPGLAEADMGWGKPVILAAMKKIYYLQVLQKGNEAIANEHIVPKKAISPANTTTLDPYTQMNLGKWKGEIETTVKRWKQDPNYIAVFPIPVAYQELGGNARALLLTPEMRFLEETIINSLGVPVEFIKGGASWTGSSISLRIVENMFLSYRAMLEDFINHFIIEKVVSNFKYEKVKMRFKDFKMADDAAAKQLMLQLSEMGKLSDASLLDSFGLNYNANKTQLEESANEDIDRAVKRSKKEAEAQGEAAVVLAKFNAIAQAEAQAELLRYRIQQFQEELIDEFGSVDANFFNLIEQLTLGLLYMAPEMQIVELDKLKTKTPITHNLVMERINAYQSANIMPTGANLSLKKQAPNQKSPGERESNQVKPREKEKTKGATRGEENI